jgi:hypothetical protein
MENQTELDQWRKLKRKVKYLRIALRVNPRQLYNRMSETDDELVSDPDTRFKQYWKGWHDFLGINTIHFLQTKREWIDRCRELDIHTTAEYYNACSIHPELSYMPAELYRDFRSISQELYNAGQLV